VVGEMLCSGIVVGVLYMFYWDWIVMFLVMWYGGVLLCVFIKKEVFKGLFGVLLWVMGGILVDC